MITSHKKDIASTTLACDLKVTQKTAWFILHRLRHAARTRSFNRPLERVVEVDETFIGGKEKNKHANKRQICGIHHWISDKHLGSYLSEMTRRYNRRDIDGSVRVDALLGPVEGRLRNKELIA